MEEKKVRIEEEEKDQKTLAETFRAAKKDDPQKAKELFAFMKGLMSGYDIGAGNMGAVRGA